MTTVQKRWWQIVNFSFNIIGYGRTGSDPAVHSTSSMKTYNLKWYQRDQQRRHSTKNREAKGTPPSHCSTEQLIQNYSKVNKTQTLHVYIHLTRSDSKMEFSVLLYYINIGTYTRVQPLNQLHPVTVFFHIYLFRFAYYINVFLHVCVHTIRITSEFKTQ